MNPSGYRGKKVFNHIRKLRHEFAVFLVLVLREEEKTPVTREPRISDGTMISAPMRSAELLVITTFTTTMFYGTFHQPVFKGP